MDLLDEKDEGLPPEDFMNKVRWFDFNNPGIQHDRVLIVEEKKFYVQSGFLSIWSEYFCSLFNSDFNEKNKAEIELKELSADEFEVFLKVIYPEFFKIQAAHIEFLVVLAYRFLAPNVLELCKKFIEKELNSLDKLMLFKLASNHNLDKLKDKTLAHIINNIKEFDIIQLLKVAFEFNEKSLKTNLRYMIYSAEREEKWYKCSQCTGGIERKTCTHQSKRAIPLTRNSLIAENIDKILQLPVEIRDFVLISSIRYN